MKKMMRAVLGLVLSFSAMGSMAGEKAGSYSIGVAVDTVVNEFNSSWIRHLENHPHVKSGMVKLRYYLGYDDLVTQREQFRSILCHQHDAIIVVADDLNLNTGLFEKAAAMGIPVIASTGHADSERATSFIGPDDEAAGYLAARALFAHMGGEGRVAVLNGPMAQGAARFRDRGLERALREFPGIGIVETRSVNWSKHEAERVVRNWLAAYPDSFDAIYAQNDEMALGAVAALKNGGRPLVPVVGIDGIDEALRSIENGEMLLTLRQSALAESQGALDLALRRVIGPGYAPAADCWGPGLDWADGLENRYIVPWQPVAAR